MYVFKQDVCSDHQVVGLVKKNKMFFVMIIASTVFTI